MVRVALQTGEGDFAPSIRAFSHQQSGRGPFKNFFHRVVLPGLKYLGKKAIKTGSSVATDVIDGEDFKESMKRRFKETKQDSLKDLGLVGAGKRRRKKGKKRKGKTGIKRKVKRAKTSDIFS